MPDEDPHASYAEDVQRKADRMLAARKRTEALWAHVAHVGVLGFVFVVPVLAGAFVGRLIAQRTGGDAAAVLGILLGVAIGAFGAWRQIQRSLDSGSR